METVPPQLKRSRFIWLIGTDKSVPFQNGIRAEFFRNLQ
jgi:hypothetical protein